MSGIVEAAPLDPWNWKFPSRDSLMSLDKIRDNKDLVRAKTAHGIRTKRMLSHNLSTEDISGAKPKVFIAKNP